jgi:hypothetical protein
MEHLLKILRLWQITEASPVADGLACPVGGEYDVDGRNPIWRKLMVGILK